MIILDNTVLTSFAHITGALGLALFAGSLLGTVYSFMLALVLSHIADAEEEELRARFGEGYSEYAERVPKLLPRVQRIFR